MQHKELKGSNSETSRWLTVVFFGTFVRVVFMVSGFHDSFYRNVQVVSPVTSWFRVTECVALASKQMSPYSGDICHHPPLVVQFFQVLPAGYSFWFFLFCDILTAMVLYTAAASYTSKQLSDQEKNKTKYASDTAVLLLDECKLRNVPLTVMAFYLVNPYTLVSCVAQSTVILSNLVTAMVLLCMVNRWFSLSCVCIAMSSYLSLYPIMLLVPVTIYACQKSCSVTVPVIKCLTSLILMLCGLLYTSYKMDSSWQFVYSVYGFILEAPDLTPNMGLFWYFFLEMFDHFRLFFLWVYQINAFIYTVPLAVIFRKQPMLICYALISLVTLFKSYSTFGDLSLPIALLPLWSYTYRYMRNVLLIMAMLLFTSVLGPGMWHLWVYAGSGNSNFFYAVTLAYCTAQIFLLSDVLYAHLRYEYHLYNGMSPKTSDGKEGTVVMK